MEAVGSEMEHQQETSLYLLRGLMFHGFHGVKPEEKKLAQKFLIDVDAWMDLRSTGKSDNISDTISYAAIYRNNNRDGPWMFLCSWPWTIRLMMVQVLWLKQVQIKLKPHPPENTLLLH